MFKNFFKDKETTAKGLVEKLLQDLLEQGDFQLSFSMDQEGPEIFINIFGEDEGLLKTRDGRLLLAFQTYFNRVVHAHYPDEELFVRVDSENYFNEKDERLFDLARKLKEKALATGKAVYFRKALPPFQRRKVHQLLNKDKQVKTVSEGDGFYKNICIIPASIKTSKSFPDGNY